MQIRITISPHTHSVQFSSVQFSHSVMSDSLQSHELQRARPPCPSPTPKSPPKPMSIKSMMPSNHLILCCPLLLLPSIFPSIRVFSNESALRIRWPRYWSFSFNISPSNEHPWLISFRMDWLDLLAVQGTLKNLLQHHSSKASILWCSAECITIYFTNSRLLDVRGKATPWPLPSRWGKLTIYDQGRANCWNRQRKPWINHCTTAQ